MKVWIKYLIGIAFGVLTAVLLPVDSVAGSSVISFLTELFQRFGRYLVVPIIFASAIVSINKLRNSKILLKSIAWTFGFIVISSLLLALVGLISILLVRLPRIPITNELAGEIAGLDIKGLILSLFPLQSSLYYRYRSFYMPRQPGCTTPAAGCRARRSTTCSRAATACSGSQRTTDCTVSTD